MIMLTKDNIKKTLLSRFEDTTYNSLAKIPNFNRFKDMQKATLRAVQAIKNRERIVVVGDYDVDGIVSTALMLEFFEHINYPIEYIIPNRFKDGYGISSGLLDRVEADLIITVDNGITAYEASDKCEQKGIDLIITDHHTPLQKLPNAYAIINPKQDDCNFEFKPICGAQVAWYFIASLNSSLNSKYNLKKALSIVGLAIVADVMPLVGLNRTMLKEGLVQMMTDDRASISVLKDEFGGFSSQTIAFFISPKLNSAGRLGDASLSVEFLRASNRSLALKLWQELNQKNEIRKEIEIELFDQAYPQVDSNDLVSVVWGEEWNEGVIGIIASRLVDKYSKPAIVLSINSNTAKGSARSIGDVDIFELIKSQSSLLIGFGGHKGAAGLSIDSDKLEIFKTNINQVAKQISKSDFIPLVNVFGEISLDMCDFELLDILDYFEPYGEGNEMPLFRLNNLKVKSVRYMGKDAKTLKLTLQNSTSTIDAIEFRSESIIEPNQIISLIVQLNRNIYNNRQNVQLLIKEIP
jgi:single-stranded-DNA-specific exonuclease